MVKIEINTKQLEKAIENLPVNERAELVERLMKKTWKQRFRKLRARIGARVKKYPITQKEINQIVEEAREEYHAKNRR